MTTSNLKPNLSNLVNLILKDQKDSHWVGASLEHSVPEALEFAQSYGHSITMVAEKVRNILTLHF